MNDIEIDKRTFEVRLLICCAQCEFDNQKNNLNLRINQLKNNLKK